MIYFKDKIIIENEANIYLENKMFAYQNIIQKGKSRKIRFPFSTIKMIVQKKLYLLLHFWLVCKNYTRKLLSRNPPEKIINIYIKNLEKAR